MRRLVEYAEKMDKGGIYVDQCSFQNLALQLGLGQQCQSEGIAIPCSSYS